jgi:hypothetical protein
MLLKFEHYYYNTANKICKIMIFTKSDEITAEKLGPNMSYIKTWWQ